MEPVEAAVSCPSDVQAVLLVEDSPGDASLIRSALAEGPGPVLEVLWQTSLQAGLQALATRRFACIVADLGLPDGDGVDVVTSLRAAAADTPLVVLTGRFDEQTGAAAIRCGADDYLRKEELAGRPLRRAVDYAVERGEWRAAQRRLEARSQAVLDALGLGVLVYDADGRVALVNPAASSLLGYDARAMLGRAPSEAPGEFLGSDGQAMSVAELPSARTRASGRPAAQRDVGFRLPDGQVNWADISAYPLRTPEGASDGVVVTLQDVSARHAAEEADRFRAALLAAVGQAVIVTDPAGTVLFWNPAAERMYGWAAEEVVGRPVLEVTPSERSAQIMAAVSRGESWTGDVLARRRDGSSLPALVTSAPVFDQSGRLTAVIAVSADISDRKEAERTARELSAIVTSTADAVFTTTPDGVITSWNGGAEQLYGYRAEDVLGQPKALLDPSGGEEAARIVAAAAAGETVTGLETVRHRRDGSPVDVSLTVSPVFAKDGTVSAVSVIARDIGDRRRLERELRRQALYDPLTGLPNRALLTDRLTHALQVASLDRRPVSVLFCDLDHFKDVNDSAGHLAGDELLVEVAHRLTMVVRPADTVARFGGDEFVVVCEDTDTAQAERIAARVADALREAIPVGGTPHQVSASIGIAVSPPLDADSGTLLRHADAAMYAAKSAGRARWRVFDTALAAKSAERVSLSDELREALRTDALQVHYQPQVALGTGSLVGVEALVRWPHPTRGAVPPALFVTLAEDAGFITELDQWVLTRACRDAAELRRQGLLGPDTRLAVNRSARAVTDTGLSDAVACAAQAAGLPLRAVELEVTETGLMSSLAEAAENLTALRALGVGVALDDFGTGYSSLTYVRQLPVSTIKVDRSFVEHVADRPDDLAIVESIIDLGKALGLDTVAEGVETTEQLAVLHRLGCVTGQGYLWSPALPVEQLADLLRGCGGRFLAARDVALARVPRGAFVPAGNEHGLHRILNMHRDGASLATIAAALNADGYRTPAGLRWHGRSVARVIATRLEAQSGEQPARPVAPQR